MLAIYNLLFLLALLFSSPVLLYLAIVRGHSLKERLGFQDREALSSLGTHPRIWFHAASVGEIKTLAPLLPHFKSAFPDHKILISTTTKTGRDQARRLIPYADLFTYLPLDFGWCVRRALRALNPEALLIVETELWPNLLSLAKKLGIKTFLVNGRISSRSFRSYKRFRFLFAPLLSGVDSFLMQSEIDGERIVKIGAPPERVKVLGNIKFDYLALEQELIDKDKQGILNALFSGRRVVVAGSTRRGEEEVVLEAFRGLRSQFPDSLLILAPRHLARLKDVESLLNQGGWRFVRRCRLEGAGADNSLEVILLDTMGELLTFYSLSEVAFVGGSLVPVGGHDPLEPAAFAVPVLFGPHMQNAADSRDLLLKSGGAREVGGAEELRQALIELLSDEERRRKMGQSAQRVIDDNAGISSKMVEVLKSRLDAGRNLQ
jgi:3-deoxy-D-manno-octulosonic-acid transferase